MANSLDTMPFVFVAKIGHCIHVPDQKDAMNTLQSGYQGKYANFPQSTPHIELQKRLAIATAWPHGIRTLMGGNVI